MAIAQTLAAWAGECVRNGRRQALPPAAYSDGEMLALERRQIFARAWIAVAHISQLRAVGDYITFEIAGHPVLAVHGADGKLRAFSNVCQHHSAPVAAGSGRRTVFRCPYHAWTYGLDGALLGAPYMDKAALGGIALPPLALETWQGLVFVNLDAAAPPLAPDLTALEPRIAPLVLERQQTVLCEDLEMACNWKLLVENFCESYHVFSVHKATLEKTTPTASIENRADGDAFNHHIQRTGDAFSLAAGRQRAVAFRHAHRPRRAEGAHVADPAARRRRPYRRRGHPRGGRAGPRLHGRRPGGDRGRAEGAGGRGRQPGAAAPLGGHQLAVFPLSAAAAGHRRRRCAGDGARAAAAGRPRTLIRHSRRALLASGQAWPA